MHIAYGIRNLLFCAHPKALLFPQLNLQFYLFVSTYNSNDNNVFLPADPSMFSESGVQSISFEDLAHEATGLSTEEPQDMEVLAISGANSIAIILYTSGSTGIPKGR